MNDSSKPALVTLWGLICSLPLSLWFLSRATAAHRPFLPMMAEILAAAMLLAGLAAGWLVPRWHARRCGTRLRSLAVLIAVSLILVFRVHELVKIAACALGGGLVAMVALVVVEHVLQMLATAALVGLVAGAAGAFRCRALVATCGGLALWFLRIALFTRASGEPALPFLIAFAIAGLTVCPPRSWLRAAPISKRRAAVEEWADDLATLLFHGGALALACLAAEYALARHLSGPSIVAIVPLALCVAVAVEMRLAGRRALAAGVLLVLLEPTPYLIGHVLAEAGALLVVRAALRRFDPALRPGAGRLAQAVCASLALTLVYHVWRHGPAWAGTALSEPEYGIQLALNALLTAAVALPALHRTHRIGAAVG